MAPCVLLLYAPAASNTVIGPSVIGYFMLIWLFINEPIGKFSGFYVSRGYLALNKLDSAV
jgi:hypothetical protein